MALTGSGALSLNEMHVEAGGTSGDECSINDTDIRGLIDKDAGATMAINEWYGASASFYDFPISNSLRLGEDGHLTHTNGSDSASRQKFTFSTWLKISSVGTAHHQLFDATANYGRIYFTADDNGGNTIRVLIGDGSSNADIVTNRKFRDVSSWFHLVVAVDTTQGTASNRVKIYINGVQETSFNRNTIMNQNVTTRVGGTALEFIGAQAGPDTYFKGYLAETHYIVNAQLTPSSFGETKNDIWIPKDTAGLTYGTNGYRLQYKQTGTSANSSGIGADTSGNDNHWTPVNLVASDVVPDSPTNNFATYNATKPDTTGAQNHGFSEGNLKVTNLISSGAKWWNCFGTISMSSGKYYWEHSPIGSGTVDLNIGVCTLDWYRGSNGGADTADAYTLYANSGGKGFLYTDDESSPVDKGTGYYWSWGDVMGVAFDADTGKIWYAKNGTFLGSGDPAAGSNAAHTVTSASLAKGMLPVFSGEPGGKSAMVNFGQDSSFAGNETAQGNADANGIGDFYYTPPSGFLALCTANLPDPHASIDPNQDASVQDYFQTKLYTGNGASSLDIDLDFDPEVVWIKNRSSNYSHILANKLVGSNKFIATNGNGAEETDDTKFRDFLTTSFRVGTHDGVNANNSKYVSWNWRAGASTSANTDGTINTSATSATPMGSYSIGLYTGNATNNQTIGHGLGATPDIVIIRPRNHADNWVMSWGVDNLIRGYNASYMYLNTNGAAGGGSNGYFLANDADTVNLGTSWNNINTSGKLYFMQCYRSVDGVSKCGVYSGNSSADGTFVNTGFRPAWILFKKLNSSDDWAIHDNMRADTDVATGNSNAIQKYLKPNESNAEQDDGDSVDFVSNGFKWRINSGMRNNSGDKYLYIAFAHQPFKYANAR